MLGHAPVSHHKLLVIHPYVPVFSGMHWLASRSGFKLPWLSGQMALSDKFTFLKPDATVGDFLQVYSKMEALGSRAPKDTLVCVLISHTCSLP